MNELTSRERLQPSLLDRLTDEEPGKAVEGPDKRVLSLTQLKSSVLRDLAWLGLAPDAMARQSARLDSYRIAFEKLKASGHVYPAYETEAELERKRALLKARRLPPIYDRAALDPATRARWEVEGRRPHWRFKLSRTKISWTDLIRGPVEIDAKTRDIIQNEYIRKLERVDGMLKNVEFDTFKAVNPQTP